MTTQSIDKNFHSLICSNLKISVSWVFVTVHLHVRHVSFLGGCCRVYLDESMSDGLSPFMSLHHDDSYDDDDKYCHTADSDTDKVGAVTLTGFGSER